MYVEHNCTFHHEGRTYEAGGAVVMGDYAVAYIGKPDGRDWSTHVGNSVGPLTNWRGETIGRYRIVSSWLQGFSHPLTRMYQIEATIDGVTYTGRGQGKGMIWRGKRKA
jgi:hypothetical protein